MFLFCYLEPKPGVRGCGHGVEVFHSYRLCAIAEVNRRKFLEHRAAGLPTAGCQGHRTLGGVGESAVLRAVIVQGEMVAIGLNAGADLFSLN